MKEENKKEVKKNIITGVSTASGAAVGTIVEDVMKPFIASAENTKEPSIISIEENAHIGNPEGKIDGPVHEEIQESVVSFAAPDVTVHEEPVITSTESAVEEAIVGIEGPVEAGPSISSVEAQVVAEAPVENEAPEEMESAIVGVETISEEIDGIEVVTIENPEEGLEIAVENMDPEFIEPSEDNPEYMENENLVEYDDDSFGDTLIEGNFTDTRVEGFGHMTSASNEMPDYVNNANIDSFMDLG